ncbi:MAG TPA: mannose-1-phosphate guanylyltransferase [Candidatus Methylomirabilis sp.]|nr:mannose-1-phosphate guanylyltransferase [Candidatus Methylomirabilis sp.]
MGSDHAFVVVLAGGRGERFWPLSTGALPKAFLHLVGRESLLQATVRRARLILPWPQILVVAGRAHADVVRAQLPELPEGNLLLEPFGRDTAAALGFASLHLERRDPEAVMAVLPADHHIPHGEAFAAGLGRAFDVVKVHPNWVVTIGIPPTRPEIGYGYLEAGEALSEVPGAFSVRRFLEKPDLDTVWNLLQEGRYYWNSGMFIWRSATIQGLLERHMPEEWAGFRRIREAWGIEDVLVREFSAFRRMSVDYGVLERMDSGMAMIPADFAWDDLGSWDALARVLPVEENGNVIIGDVRSLDTSGSIIVSTDQRVATLGVSDMIVIASRHGVLVCPRGRSQEVRRLVGEAR